MTKGFSRAQRVEDLIQTALAEMLQRDADSIGVGMITVTDVKVAHDLSFAKVYVSVFDENKAEDILQSLNQAAKSFRFELAKMVKLRITPELKFIYDDSILRGHRISSLINNALKPRKTKNKE